MIEPNDVQSLRSQLLKLEQKNKSLREKFDKLRHDSSSSNEVEEALISQYEVSPLDVCFHELMSVQHKLSLANHVKDEAVEALRIAEVRPGFMYVRDTRLTLTRDLIG